MPDWKKFADLLGMAQYGDAVRAVEEKKRKEGIEAEQLGFQRSANQRAESAAGRQAEEFEYEKTKRPLLEKQLQQQVEAGNLTLKEAQNKLAVFDAGGGVQGEVTRQRGKEQRESGTYEQGRKESEARIRNMDFDNARQAAHQKIADELANLQLEIQKATKDAQIKGIKDQSALKDAQELRAMVDALRAANTEEDYNYLMGKIKDIQQRNEIRKLEGSQQTAANAANPQAAPASAPPQGAPVSTVVAPGNLRRKVSRY